MTTPLQPPFRLRDDEDSEETSPLGDYLADAESSFEPLGSPFAPSYEDATVTRRRRRTRGSITPRRRASPHKVARVPATRESSPSSDEFPEAGPSRIPLDAMEPPVRRVDTTFAERFKYLIASSGLLEKTQIDPRCGPDENETKSEAASSTNPKVPTVVVSEPEESESKSSWDVLATLSVVVTGLAYVLGPSKMVPATALAAGLALLHPASPKDYDYDLEDEIVTGTPSLRAPDSPESAYTSLPVSPDEDPVDEAKEEHSISDRVFASLESLLTESRNLDQTITSSLQILAPYPDDLTHAHALRVALNRLLEDMTDSFAACTSSLIPMADRAELAVLGEMYDIPMLGPRRMRPRSSSIKQSMDMMSRRTPSISESPHASLALSPIDPDDKFTKLPDRTLRQRRSNFSADWTSPSPTYRSLPEGIPENCNEESGSDCLSSTESSGVPSTLPDVSGPLSPTRNLQPFSPKRASPLAQTLERLEGGGAPTLPTSPPFPVLSSSGNMGYRRSLQDIRYIPSVPTSTSEAAANLALARASANLSSANRRSLQMPVQGEALGQAILAAGANLHRAWSMPQRPGLRPLATSSSPTSKRTSMVSDSGSPNVPKRISLRSDGPVTSPHSSPSSRRTSIMYSGSPRSGEEYATLGIGLAPRQVGRLQRIASVSPLTLGGLKASYFGVHQKRRRVACCLLGLRFCAREEDDEAYWSSVSEALRVLGAVMSLARERLEVVRQEAEKEARAAQTMSDLAHPGTEQRSSTHVPYMTQRPTDFAPRDTTEQALLASVDEVQRTLARVWAKCDEMRTRVASGEADSLAETWSDMRTDIGGLLRHVERGRELSRRDDAESESAYEQEPETTTPPMPMPEFLRRWADPGPEELERSVDDSLDSSFPEEEDLPPQGVDEVFEAEIPAANTLRARSALSREERIALTREARAKGISVQQLMASTPEQMERERQRALSADRMRAETEMISELQGLFGAIRKRKGMADE